MTNQLQSLLPRCSSLLALVFATCTASAGIESPVYVSSAVEFPGGRSTFYAPHGVGSRVAEGSLAGVDAGGVELAGSHWPVAFFSSLTARPHYLIVTSGDYNGMSVMISGTDSATNYIALAEDISSEIIGTESFRIREALTLDDMFGPLNEAGFLGDISFNSADNLIIYAPGTNAQSIAYNYISGSLNLGWRANNRSRTPAGMRSILPYQLIEVKRTLSPTTQAVHFQQQVRDEDLLVPVNSGLNFVGMALADSQLTLANSGIADVLPSAASLRSASSLVKTQPFFIAFHHLNNDWRNAVTFTFTPDEPLISGEGFQINRRPSGTVLWRIFSDL